MSIKVEAFSAPGCAKCAKAKDMLKAIVDELGPDRVSWRDVNILEELDYAVALGVFSPPAIAIDGEGIADSTALLQVSAAAAPVSTARLAWSKHGRTSEKSCDQP